MAKQSLEQNRMSRDLISLFAGFDTLGLLCLRPLQTTPNRTGIRREKLIHWDRHDNLWRYFKCAIGKRVSRRGGKTSVIYQECGSEHRVHYLTISKGLSAMHLILRYSCVRRKSCIIPSYLLSHHKAIVDHNFLGHRNGQSMVNNWLIEILHLVSCDIRSDVWMTSAIRFFPCFFTKSNIQTPRNKSNSCELIKALNDHQNHFSQHRLLIWFCAVLKTPDSQFSTTVRQICLWRLDTDHPNVCLLTLYRMMRDIEASTNCEFPLLFHDAQEDFRSPVSQHAALSSTRWCG
jgi:hypothetical protein